MKRLNNMKIAAKLITSFIIVALIAGIVGMIGIINITTINKDYIILFNQDGKPLSYTGDAMSDFQRIRGNLRDIIIDQDKDLSVYTDNIAIHNSDLDTSLDELASLVGTKELSQISLIRSDISDFRAIQDEIINYAMEGKTESAIELLRGEGKTLADDIDNAFNKLQDEMVSDGNKSADSLTQSTNSTIIILIVVVIIAVILAIILGIFVSRLISSPIKELVITADKLSKGDINVNVKAASKDEIGKLMEAFNRMISNIREQALAVETLAGGDMNIEIKAKSENDLLNQKLSEMVQTIKSVVEEIGNLAEGAVEGNLSKRGDTKKYKGEYRNIISGINNTLDAVLEPINESSAILEEMSKGNLQILIEGDYKGDHAIMKNAINNTIISFNEILGSINTASEQVAFGSKQISSSSISLSQGSTEQASSIEEITASIEEIATQTRQNATNADQANELASSARDKAVQGNEQMAEMLKAMAEINDSSNNISKIIKVIDDIAFQTNILALNAAVEAARAGQHGKGFAVVAEEVRNLAARSANAAKETTSMIEGSIKKVDAGTKIANDTALALNQIVEGIAKAAGLVGDIAIASNEQASGIAQVNQAINQVAQVVQTNSSTSEESAAASEELSSQAELLKDLVNKYKLKKSSTDQGNPVELSPEVLRMLESMTAKKTNPPKKTAKSETGSSNLKIDLDDTDFDKY